MLERSGQLEALLDLAKAGRAPVDAIAGFQKDGAEFAANLRRRLEAKNLNWQDLVALEGGRDWWSQIENAPKSTVLQHFVLVVAPKACGPSSASRARGASSR